MGYFPFKVMPEPEEMRRHLEEATEASSRFMSLIRNMRKKPYDSALGLYLTLAALCKEFDWDPRDFHRWVADQFPKEVPVVPVIDPSKASQA